jgi:hypothetical protein
MLATVLLLSLLPILTLSQAAVRLACLEAGYPDCFCTCYAPLIRSHCPLDPVICPCTDTPFIDEVGKCVLSNCAASEVQSARAMAEKDCLSVGAPLPTDAFVAGGTSGVVVPTTGTATAIAKSTSTTAGSSGAPVSEGKKKELGAGAIAGIVVGVVGGITAGAAITYLLLRRRRRPHAPKLPLPSQQPEPPQVQAVQRVQPDYGGKTELHSDPASLHPFELPTKAYS